MKRFRLAPYIGTPEETYETILQLGELKPGEIFYDLGAGDFGLVLKAVKPPYNAAKSVGIELREDLTTIAEEKVKKEGLEDRVKIIHGNVLSDEINISDADLVYIYLSDEGNAMIRPKLERQLRDEARVVSNNFFIPDWIYSDCKVVRAPIVLEGIISPPIYHYFYLYEMKKVRR